MTKQVGPARTGSARRVVRILSDLVESLPTEAERRAVHESLHAVIAYLQQAERDLQAIPTTEDFRSLSDVLLRLDKLLALAEDNPLLAKPLGLTKQSGARPGHVEPLSQEKVASVLKQFDSMTIDQVRETLMTDTRYSTGDLRALAASLRVRVQARMSREALASHITTKVANARGYRQLSGDSSTPPQETSAHDSEASQ